MYVFTLSKNNRQLSEAVTPTTISTDDPDSAVRAIQAKFGVDVTYREVRENDPVYAMKSH